VVAWLYAVTRNLARTAGRAERRRRRHEAAAASRSPGWFIPTEGGGLDGQTAAAALASLPSEEREAVVARVWGGLNFEQIGGLLGTSAATAHRRFTAGLELLRERLTVPCPSSRSTPNLPR
jgi:RNA polymerase sigma-70 factor (ECF subfamily)